MFAKLPDQAYMLRPEMVDMYKVVPTEAWYGQTAQQPDEHKKVQLQIKELEGRLSYAMELASSQQIEPVDFRQMSADYKAKIESWNIQKLTTFKRGL